LCAKITLPQGNNRDISFGNPENAHIFGRREQAPRPTVSQGYFRLQQLDKPEFEEGKDEAWRCHSCAPAEMTAPLL